jgi:hypothetical protein
MRTLRRIIPLGAVALLLAGLIGCSSGGGATEVGKTLYSQLGGADGVTKLANQFGANIASNPTLNSMLDATVIGNVKTGFTNDVMKASGLTPSSATTMASALAGKGLDATGINALGNSLKEAGASVGLNSATMNSLTSAVISPLSKSLLGGGGY